MLRCGLFGRTEQGTSMPTGCRTMEMNGRSSLSYLARTPCIPLFCTLCLIGVETEGLLDFQGRAGITSIVRWNLRPVIFGVEYSIDTGKGAKGPHRRKPRKTLAVHFWRGFCPEPRAHSSDSSKGSPPNCRGKKLGHPKTTSKMSIRMCLLSSPASP